MYPNLIKAMNDKRLSFNAAAAVVKMPEATYRTKVQTRSFTVEEAFEIKKHMFPEYDLPFLFERIDTNT